MKQSIVDRSDMREDKLVVVQNAMLEAPAGVFGEVGTRLGGTALLALDQPNCQMLITVDPYGNKPFRLLEGIQSTEFDDLMYIETQVTLSSAAQEVGKVHMHYKTTGADFLSLDHVLWIEGRRSQLKDLCFAFVLLDGDHTDEAVGAELEGLEGRMMEGGVLLLDNSDWLTLPLKGFTQVRPDMKVKIF